MLGLISHVSWLEGKALHIKEDWQRKKRLFKNKDMFLNCYSSNRRSM